MACGKGGAIFWQQMFTEHPLRTYPWARLDSVLKEHTALNYVYYKIPRTGAFHAGASAPGRGGELSAPMALPALG